MDCGFRIFDSLGFVFFLRILVMLERCDRSSMGTAVGKVT